MESHLDLITIVCEDLEATTRFYTEFLGFSVLEEFTRPGDFVWLKSSKDGTASLVLQDSAQTGKNPTQKDIPLNHGGLMLAFVVEDASAYYEHWKSAGLPLRTEMVNMGKGMTFGTNDPEGNYVQVVDVFPEVRERQRQIGLE